jgi:hypothetical protein
MFMCCTKRIFSNKLNLFWNPFSYNHVHLGKPISSTTTESLSIQDVYYVILDNGKEGPLILIFS